MQEHPQPPETPEQRVYADFSRLLMAERPVRIDEDRVVADPERVDALKDSFLSVAGNDLIYPHNPSRKIVDVIADNLKNHFGPIVRTRDTVSPDKSILMTWGGENLLDYITWLGIKLSFEQSGVTVVAPESDAERRSVWIRDSSFILGDTIYLPDPEWDPTICFGLTANGELVHDDDALQDFKARRYSHLDILKDLGMTLVQVEGCFFEGGNLIPNEKNRRIFWGNDRSLYTQEKEPLRKAILDAQGEDYKIRHIKTDRRHFHLDIGLSPELPGGHFLVAYNLGRDIGDYESDGYDQLKNHYLDRKRIIDLDLQSSAEFFCTNLVPVGNTLFMTACPPDLQKKLEDLGYIVNTPTPAHIESLHFHFERAKLRRIGSERDGGGVRCMTNEIPLLSSQPL